ncbi:hypothetical protein TSAR_016433 [Trichomalopsis sarcophagae]|uniref:Uncharacterized protein n=1 Tax=Trichomalopsis sarcophagae TaxID=543379 RepID=A0A232EVX2_9HYME|nr:hypothetical protein TSAR_016433 [Trichomalopsis sarcophagae]
MEQAIICRSAFRRSSEPRGRAIQFSRSMSSEGSAVMKIVENSVLSLKLQKKCKDYIIPNAPPTFQLFSENQPVSTLRSYSLNYYSKPIQILREYERKKNAKHCPTNLQFLIL